MKTITKENIMGINMFLDWFIHIIVYALILLIVSTFFETINIDLNFWGIYALIASLIIFLLNKTVKPILFRLTIPLTGMTLGLFYPCINIIILKITDFILGIHFETYGIITLFLTAILISVINLIINEAVIKKILRKGEKNE